jgi:hypothetical protein
VVTWPMALNGKEVATGNSRDDTALAEDTQVTNDTLVCIRSTRRWVVGHGSKIQETALHNDRQCTMPTRSGKGGGTHI